jgi:ssDNA-binding Zn-finger/Zn-ribbon topoisomerase 1
MIHMEDINGDNTKEVLTSGTFLRSYCPHCERSLIERNQLKLTVVMNGGEKGTLLLSPYLNVFTSRSTINIPELHAADDLKCPHCTKSLMVKDQTCPRCGSEIAKIKVAAMSKMIDFHICSKKGCTWHGISADDLQDMILEDSEEW